MPTELRLDPELAAAVARARLRAAEHGEWPPKVARHPFQPSIPPEAVEVISDWLRDGGYRDAIAQIAADDPDLADE